MLLTPDQAAMTTPSSTSAKKPAYKANPAHDPRGLHAGKTPEPADAMAVYENAIPGPPPSGGKLGRNWYGRGANSEIYRFSDSGDQTAHFTGMTNYPPRPLRFEDIPIEVRRALGRTT